MRLYIKEARERVGLSQKELADSLGIKPQTFNGYETGKHDPKSDILIAIAQRCNTTVDFLLGRTSNPDQIKNAPTDNGEGESENERDINIITEELRAFLTRCGFIRDGQNLTEDQVKAILVLLQALFKG